MMADWVRSKPWLGLLGNLSATMATASAFGFCIYLGIDFIGINLAAPFLMIGKLVVLENSQFALISYILPKIDNILHGIQNYYPKLHQ